MKVVPAIPFPSPEAGVVISEHPKTVGIQGAVDGANFIKRDGSLVTRPGFVSVVTLDVPWSGAGDAGGSPVALASFDYQKDGVNTRDRLLAVLQDRIYKFNSDFTGNVGASYDNLYDWSWDAVYGRGPAGLSEPMVRVDDIEVIVTSPDGINWSAFNSSSMLAVGVSIMMNPVTSTVRCVFHKIFSSITDVKQPDVHDIPVSYLGDVGGYTLPLVIDDKDTNLAVQFNVGQEILESYIYTTSIGKALIIKPAIWYKVFYRSSKWGIPDPDKPNGRGPTSGVVSFDEDDRPVVRTWDWGGQTHALIAADGEWLLDVYELDTSTLLKVNTCGAVGDCPKAKTIAIAGERVVAGNITYFNSSDVVTDPTNQEYILKIGPGGYPVPEFHRLNYIPGFAYVPDAVIFSQTVLQNGHRGWYPGDVLRLADTPGEIVAMNEIGTMQCAVYKSDAIYVLTVQAGLAPFAPSLRASGIQGPVGPRAVTSITDTTHVYLGRDGGVYIFDGGPPKSMGDHIKTWVGREIDPEHVHKAFILFNKYENEVILIYPVHGSGGRGFKGAVIDIAGGEQGYTLHPIEFASKLPSGDWSHTGTKDADYTCACLHYQSNQPLRMGGVTVPTEEIVGTATSTYPEMIWGAACVETLGRILKSQRDGSDLGIPIKAHFVTGTTDLGDPDSQKVLLEIEHLIDPKSEIYSGTEIEAEVTLYAGNVDRKLKQVDQQTIDLTADPPYVSGHRVSARYFAYRLDITCPAADETNGIRGEIAVGGGFARFNKTGYRNAGVSK
jgi:hypothetical protein